ncbi:MarR family winged helix-turn-helix transcriptional regulator [Cellulomonas sp. PhB143]|uniref:MarR family winged helix-turn-helix transcriptional regulator n=1 Tax=Cellulomonas sp. PhB143 TaxID=2485186 RepID=UPI000F4A51D4|nr:MarR family transcriptional regulator [Cellulomonas sp. PhB143]ROS78652.1 MarR family transcriptional regulator [Cellulomonas sp. PhB143]
MPADDVLARIELEVGYLLRRADRASRRRDRTPPTLERSAYLVLQSLVTDGPANVHVLADRLGLDASTMTRQVGAMVAAGHVRRTPDPGDARAVLVEPTPDGVATLARHRAERGALYAQILDGWDDGDRAALAATLHRLNRAMDEHSRG